MSNVFAAVGSTLAGMAKRTIKSRSFTKDDLITLLNQNIEAHSNILYTLKGLDTTEMRDWYLDATTQLKSADNAISKAYDVYRANLRSKAASEEMKKPLGSLASANEEYVKVLKAILKNVDDLMLEEKVTIYETRVSLVAALGMIQQSTNVYKFSLYLYTSLVKVTLNDLDSQPGYRREFLVNNAEKVANCVTDLLNKKGAYDFLNDINKLRNQAMDVVLGDGNVFGVTGGMSPNRFFPSIFDYLISALSCLNIFGAAMNLWDDYCVWRNDSNKETKEWLETHTTLLRMKLQGMDNKDPSYAKTEKIIQTYEKMITDLDQKIAEFEEGD